jgi:hypothetical protein
VDVNKLSDEYLSADQKRRFRERYEISVESLDEINALLSSPQATLGAAGIPIEDTSTVTLSVSRLPPPPEEGTHYGIGIAIHTAACDWGIFLEVFSSP